MRKRTLQKRPKKLLAPVKVATKTTPAKKPAKAASGKEPIIRIRNLSVTYFPGRSNEVQALKGIDLEIYPGEYIIFFGPSGCGKSTLLYSIAGLERNIDGDIFVKEKNLTDMNFHEVEEYHQTTVGMIFQSYFLIPSLSVLDNVALPQMAIRGNRAERLAKAAKLLEQFGVGTQGSKLPTELSGGQQQRVAISRSLMNEPDILVADEPVGNLDSKSTKDVMDLLRKLNDEQKKTVILVTHDPSHLHHAHRVFYLRDGLITGVKENTEEERVSSPVETAAGAGGMGMGGALTHWVRAYADSSAVQKVAHAVSESQHILAEVLTGMTVEEILEVEQKIYGILEKGTQKGETIYEMLSKPMSKGGIGMHKSRARKVAHDLQALSRKVKKLHTTKAAPETDDDDIPLTLLQARAVRTLLLDSLEIHLPNLESVHALDGIVQKRLEATINRKGVQQLLMVSIRKGGVGMSASLARSVSRRLEPFVFFKPEAGPATTTS